MLAPWGLAPCAWCFRGLVTLWLSNAITFLLLGLDNPRLPPPWVEERTFHIVFEYEVLACRRFNILGLINPMEKIPRRNLVKRLSDLFKGTNLFSQEQMNVE
jgi:hypothetical protein